ncbi:MAG: DUF2760 domain-containing protein [Candidatus Magnetominusculus sp. LBB02]|nr:DUF2760 domain-containing protein [Candidatus Magnetominusculus sp. LBB02]
MLNKKRLFIAIVAVTTGSAALMSFIAISLSVEKILLVGIFTAIGLISSAVVYGVVSSMAVVNTAGPEKSVVVKEREVPPFEPASAQTLMLLQKNGRLIDFLQEDISGFDDKQVGRAIREIHKGCKEALARHMKIEPVRQEAEGADVTVEAGFEPSSIRLTGNVTGHPPFRGVLRHCGWRVVKTSLPEVSVGADIVEPAEVEIL